MTTQPQWLPQRFVIEKRLGSGGMGEVYLAHDQAANGIKVAIKRIIQAGGQTSEALMRFEQEIHVSRQLKNPHIVEALEIIKEPAGVLFIMEFLSGGTLRARMQKGGIPRAESLNIIRELAIGLKAIHTEGLIHRDIKPENIFFDGQGHVKIGDFGLARMQGGETITQDNIILGTALYIPPEYIETGESDHRGDLYALGVIAYELFAETSPFPGVSIPAVLKSKFTPLSITPLTDKKVDRKLVAIISKLLAFKVSQRFQTADELLSALALI